MTVMLYKASDAPNPEVYGENIAYTVVDEADVDAALSDGWVRHPSEVAPAKPKPAKAPAKPAEEA